MLVTLGTNQTIAANSTATFQYSPTSFQKLFLRLEDADWADAKITVQVGSTTICNGASVLGLLYYSSLGCNNNTNLSGTAGGCAIDFGSHQLVDNANLTVQVQAAGELSAVDVSALVDGHFSGSVPVKYTEYSDNTFTSDNNLMAMCWDSAKAEIEEDNYNCEIRNKLGSSAPSFISASSWFTYSTQVVDSRGYAGILNKNEVPCTTTYNYNSSAVTDRILTIEAMQSTQKQVQQAKVESKV
tara:strand:- start:1830 stop:2555 length:726 start_codon:yes stop_codon:yes gene_type:complete